MSMVDRSEASSIYTTVVSLKRHPEDLHNELRFPLRDLAEKYRVSNPYSDSLWYNSHGEYGGNAIDDIQCRVEGSRKKRELDTVIPPHSRFDSFQNKKVDSPIDHDQFFGNFDFYELYTRDDRTDLKNIPMNFPETTYRKAFKELVNTESKYLSEMKLIESVYRTMLHNTKKYRNILSRSQEALIFSNITTIIDLSELFIKDISKSVNKIVTVDLDLQLKDKLSFCRVERIDIGDILTTQFIRLKNTYASYSKNHAKQIAALKESFKHGGPKVCKWLEECAYLARSRSDCWDLESLLIKPIQRIAKYPLLIDVLLKSSRDEIASHHVNNLYEAKAFLQEMVESINHNTNSFIANHDEKIVPFASGKDNSEFLKQLREFKRHNKGLEHFKKEIKLSLEPILSHILFQKKFAQSWKSFMDYDDQEKDRKYILSIYSSFIERLVQQERKTKLLIVETEEKIIKAIDLALEYSSSVKHKIHVYQSNKGAHLNYIKHGENSHNHYLENSASAAQRYITSQNELKDELPVLLSYLREFENLIVLQYHRQIQKWFEEMSGRKSLEQYQNFLISGEKILGDNFDIVELYSQSKHNTREALKDMCTRSPYKVPLSYSSYSNSDLRISASRVVRRLFGV